MSFEIPQLCRRYCVVHEEELLLPESEWVGFRDGFLCAECSASVGKVVQGPLVNDLPSASVELNKVGIDNRLSTFINEAPVSPAFQSSESKFLSLSSPYSDFFHNSSLPWYMRCLADVEKTIYGPTLTTVIFLILLGFLVACLSTFSGYVAFHSVPLRLAAEESVKKGGNFLLWLFLTCLLAMISVYVTANQFDTPAYLMSFFVTPRFIVDLIDWLRSLNCCFWFFDMLNNVGEYVSYGAESFASGHIMNTVHGTGLPEVRAVLSGDDVKEVLSFRLLLVRFIGLLFALCAGLLVGPEGPFVMISAAIAHLLSLLPIFRHTACNSYARQQLLSTAAAVGIAGVFGAPFGGLLFSIEVTSTYYPMHSYITSFLASFSASLTFFVLWNAAFGQSLLTSFLHTNFSETLDSQGYHLIYFGILGVLCALIGYFFQHLQKLLSSMFNKLAKSGINIFGIEESDDREYTNQPLEPNFVQRAFIFCGADSFLVSPYAPTLIVCVLLAIFSFPGFIGDFMSAPGITLLQDLWSPKSFADATASLKCNDWSNGASLYGNLTLFILYRLFFTAASATLPIPFGLLLPLMVIGAGVGRFMGELLQNGAVTYSAGIFAVVGAAGVTASVTQSLSVIIIILEVTGQLYFLAPLIVTVVIAVLISRRFSISIYQQLILQEPRLAETFLPPLPAWSSKALVRDLMATKIIAVTESTNLAAINTLLQVYSDVYFPVVSKEMYLLGVVNRSQLETMLNQAVVASHPEFVYMTQRKKRLDDLRNNLGIFTNLNQGTEEMFVDYSQFSAELANEIVSIPITPLPVRLLADTSVVHMHMMFISLRLHEAYVTEFGKLIGVVSRAELCQLLNISDPVDAANTLNSALSDMRQRRISESSNRPIQI